jgi:hypothetical protein
VIKASAAYLVPTQLLLETFLLCHEHLVGAPQLGCHCKPRQLVELQGDQGFGCCVAAVNCRDQQVPNLQQGLAERTTQPRQLTQQLVGQAPGIIDTQQLIINKELRAGRISAGPVIVA